jgi:hypothetical protein
MNEADGHDVAYHEVFASLAHVVLEDSWVQNIAVEPTQLTFVLDLVLTPTHPDYRPPQRDQAGCYRRGTLVLESDAAVFLRRSSLPPAVDVSGQLDYGQIDTFCPASGLGSGVWELTGSWGEATVRQPRVRVELASSIES